MKIFSELKKNLKNDFSLLRTVKIAVLGDTATPLLAQALRGTGFDTGFDLQIWEAGFNQIERQVFDPKSELYAFAPEVVIICHSSHSLLARYNKQDPSEYNSLAQDRLALIGDLHIALNAGLSARVIYYNYTEINDAVFGNYASKTPSSFLFQLRKLNYELMLYAIHQTNFYICDISSIQNQLGKATFFQSSLYINTEMVFSIDILPWVAAQTTDLIGSMYGRLKKCLILDLDNTLWGGIIGDDGIENIQLGNLGIGKVFTEFQHWIKKLKNRGIILAICSKNTESIAREPFEKHADMVLTLDDIAIFKANWDNKADNIRQIQTELNIGFDTMVFLDDNPFERALVRNDIPALTVPELPEDPANYLDYLYTLNLFESTTLTDEDANRTRQYQIAVKRNEEQQRYADEDTFLQSLNMTSAVEPFNAFNTPRIAQLSQRSNQFNLRTVRYTETDIKVISDSTDFFSFSFTLTDKFGDNGLTCAIILKKEAEDTLFIDNWFMSCRILKRGMEHFTLNIITAFAKANGFSYLKGQYLPTSKNEMVKHHYRDLGFEAHGDHWILDTGTYTPKKNYVNSK
ncbi:HAD family hydrolase [Mucilaginibacter sp. SG564]|uniref:HAD-IIIC family phosphatase n=1 Tax=Mucilaginibacter sp. SG564 TaxID=2587022 RepID=UPI0015535ABA|nr:HAD-IIIC family phosphatase [Mucilaginibacter sp. SG564]NOW94983.1 FkbH-like protein [Mucilaginibacter sp. SG564]